MSSLQTERTLEVLFVVEDGGAQRAGRWSRRGKTAARSEGKILGAKKLTFKLVVYLGIDQVVIKHRKVQIFMNRCGEHLPKTTVSCLRVFLLLKVSSSFSPHWLFMVSIHERGRKRHLLALSLKEMLSYRYRKDAARRMQSTPQKFL